MKPVNQLFKKDSIMKGLLEKYHLKESPANTKRLFLDLVEIVIGQQLSIKAADTISKRFLALFQKEPTPKQVLKKSIPDLRAVGLSNSKASYVLNIAKAVDSKDLPLEKFEFQTDEEIRKELIKIKGIGPWSVEMFLMFSLKRPDVFSVGDLGLRNAIQKLYGIKRDNLKKIEKLSQRWSPHRTLACRLLWASLTTPDNS